MAPVTTVFGYLVMVWVCKKIASLLRSPLKLNGFAALHSTFLSVVSACLLTAIVRELCRNYAATGDFYEIFADPGYKWKTGRLIFYYYINYLLKYYELIDTALLALKGKRIIFLHGYHHP